MERASPIVHGAGPSVSDTLMLVNGITLRSQRRFVADHFHDLPGFQEDRHGHNWEVEAEVALNPGTENAVVFARSFDAALDGWVSALDYTVLNDQAWLSGRNPTAEALAQWAFQALELEGFRPVEVKVREKANYWAACRRVHA